MLNSKLTTTTSASVSAKRIISNFPRINLYQIIHSSCSTTPSIPFHWNSQHTLYTRGCNISTTIALIVWCCGSCFRKHVFIPRRNMLRSWFLFCISHSLLEKQLNIQRNSHPTHTFLESARWITFIIFYRLVAIKLWIIFTELPFLLVSLKDALLLYPPR